MYRTSELRIARDVLPQKPYVHLLTSTNNRNTEIGKVMKSKDLHTSRRHTRKPNELQLSQPPNQT